MQRMTNRNAEEAKLGRPRVMTRRLVSLALVAALGTVGFLAAGSLAGGATATNATNRRKNAIRRSLPGHECHRFAR